MKMSNSKKYFLVFLLALMFSAAFLLPYIRYIFHNELVVALGTTNEGVGFLLTLYAIMNTLTLIPGGYISDKYSMKKIIVISSIGTGLLNLVLAFNQSYSVAIVVWILLGFTTIFAFWGAVIKAIRLLGDASEQGRLYGFYAGFQGIINTVAAIGATYLINLFPSVSEGLKYVLIFYAVLCIGAAIVFFMMYPSDLDALGKDSTVKREVKALGGNIVRKVAVTEGTQLDGKGQKGGLGQLPGWLREKTLNIKIVTNKKTLNALVTVQITSLKINLLEELVRVVG